MTDDLRDAVMAECLKVSRLACSIFDATEADAITPATAQEVRCARAPLAAHAPG